MKTNSFLLAFILISFFAFSQDSLEKDENFERIYWEKDKKLRWNDFKGQPDTTDCSIAISCTTDIVRFTPDEFKIDIYKVEVQHTFNPSCSWSKIKDSETILHQEQLKFDIKELTFRQLRKELKDLENGKNIKADDVDKLYKLYTEKSSNLINSFNKEVEVNLTEDRFTFWKEKIQNELALYEDYYKVDIELHLDLEKKIKDTKPNGGQ